MSSYRQGSLDRFYKTQSGSGRRKQRGRPRKYAIPYNKLTTKQKKGRQQLLSVSTVEQIAKKIVDKNKEENLISYTNFGAPIANTVRGGIVIGSPHSSHSIVKTILGDNSIPRIHDPAIVSGVIETKGKRFGDSINLKGLHLKMLFTGPINYQSFCKIKWIFYRKKGSDAPLCSHIHYPNSIWQYPRAKEATFQYEPQYQTIKSGWVNLTSKAVKKETNSTVYDTKQEAKFIDIFINLKNVKFEFEGLTSVKSNYGLMMYCYCEKQALAAVGQTGAGYFIDNGQQDLDTAETPGLSELHPTVSYSYNLYYTDTQ